MPTPTRAKAPVPAWIIRERKRLGLKPRDLAERLTAAGLPVTEGTVRTWEAGRHPHPDNVEGLERIFGTRSPDYMAKGGASGDTDPALAALLERLDRYADLVDRLVRQNAALMDAAGIIQLGGSTEDEAAIEREEQAQSTSQPRSPRPVTSGPRLSAVHGGD